MIKESQPEAYRNIKQFQQLFNNKKGKIKSNFNAIFRQKISDKKTQILSNIINNRLKDVKLTNLNIEKHANINIDDVYTRMKMAKEENKPFNFSQLRQPIEVKHEIDMTMNFIPEGSQLKQEQMGNFEEEKMRQFEAKDYLSLDEFLFWQTLKRKKEKSLKGGASNISQERSWPADSKDKLNPLQQNESMEKIKKVNSSSSEINDILKDKVTLPLLSQSAEDPMLKYGNQNKPSYEERIKKRRTPKNDSQLSHLDMLENIDQIQTLQDSINHLDFKSINHMPADEEDLNQGLNEVFNRIILSIQNDKKLEKNRTKSEQVKFYEGFQSNNFTLEQITQKLFDVFDRNGTGFIEYREFRYHFYIQGINNEKVIKKQFTIIDKFKTGKIKYEMMKKFVSDFLKLRLRILSQMIMYE